jgi:hypothetical protein
MGLLRAIKMILARAACLAAATGREMGLLRAIKMILARAACLAVVTGREMGLLQGAWARVAAFEAKSLQAKLKLCGSPPDNAIAVELDVQSRERDGP